jgi:hypothetical protein
MNATAAQTRDAVHALYGRPQAEIVGDLRAVTRVLARELEFWGDAPPSAAALVTVETTAEGIRRLLVQLRTSRAA